MLVRALTAAHLAALSAAVGAAQPPTVSAVNPNRAATVSVIPAPASSVVGRADLGVAASAQPVRVADAGGSLALRGAVACSDGSGLNADVDLGILAPGATILIDDTTGRGRGLCAYAFFGTPVGVRPESGDESVFSFGVSEPCRASIQVFDGATSQNFYLLNGSFVFPGVDILGDGTLIGDVADDAIGFVDASGSMLNASGVHEVLVPGVTYYLVADTHPAGAAGFFDIDLVLEPADGGFCPSGSIDEGEPVCSNGYEDHFNGGCNYLPNTFQPIALGETICGESGTFNGGSTRDTDWFEIVVTQTTTVRFDGLADFDCVFGLVEQMIPGLPGCDNITGIANPLVFGGPGESVAFEATLAPGTHYVFFSTTSLPACGSPYFFSTTVLSVDIDCPAGATPEREPNCADGYVDRTNGGCNAVPAVFGSVAVNETICGTAGTFDGDTRDTDWFELALGRTQTLTLTARAEFPILLGLVGQAIPGLPGCANTTTSLDPFVTGVPGEEVSFDVTLDAGTYYVFVAPAAFSGVACGSEYVFSVLDPSSCSDGAGFDVDVNLGTLSPGFAIFAGDTVGQGRDLCGYSFFGVPIGPRPQDGGEVIAQFRVAVPSLASVQIFSGGAGQDFFLLDGPTVLPGVDILGDGSLFGAVADNAVGFVDANGLMLNAFGDQDLLVPGRDYYLVADTIGDDGFFDIDFILGSGCNPADLALPFNLLDLADIVAWIGYFEGNNAVVDFVPPFGLLDLADIVAWIEQFTGGCP